MNKFKVGNRVKVVKMHPGNDHCSWVDPMNKFIGEAVTVKEVPFENVVILKEDSMNYWYFPVESLELIQGKFIDGIEVSESEFNFRTGAPVYLTIEEISEKLGYSVLLK